MDPKKYKLMDAFFVWGLCLLLFGVAGSLLSSLIGIWSYYICEVAAVGVVLVVAKRTRLKKQYLLAVGDRSFKYTLGSALLWTGATLAAIPIFFFSHLLVPNFAVSGFRIYDYTDSHLAVIGFVFLASLSETLLFDGFLYQRVKGLNKPWLIALVLGLGYGFYHLDLYVLLPLILVGIAISYIRVRCGGMLIPFVLRLISVSVSLAYTQISASSDVLTGVEMGILQVVGLAMIFMGAAIPSSALGVRLVDGWKARSGFEYYMIVIIAVVLIASGCGIASL